ncbi:C2 domain-containing protein 2-like [Centruroides sculpturatus]|uniref:C2 domain-containing protein 2-like n=1 Tax=Centruroides sculpturatus TaxID=218467 RepID=UPI000C6CE6AA|nr:C2 domain-containing protein 2-like [Centruroides sculpturatus]
MEIIIKSFKKTGISNALGGTEDEAIYEDSDDEYLVNTLGIQEERDDESVINDVIITKVQTSGKLILKLIKASNLGGSKGCIEPYCVVEIDDPGQKFETVGIKNTNSPVWEQQIIFNLNNISSEVLFETYDKGKEKDNFLGLGIVSLEELSKNSSNRHVIPLQSRPLEKDDVTGALTVEFSFLDEEGHSVSGINIGKIVETNSRVTPGGTVITTTTIKRTVDGKGMI